MRLGLLVGANQYDKLDPLKFCVQDVIAMKEVLCDASRGGFKEEALKVLVDGDKLPSKANIVDHIQLLTSKAEQEDELLFYFSVHGFEANGRAYLAPLDARTDRARDTAVDITELGEALKNSRARTKIVIMDACYSGLEPGKAGSGGMSETFESAVKEMAASGSGTVVLTSCSKGEASYEEPSFGHGVFTQFLVEGLKGNADFDGDNDITVTEAYGYAKQKVDEYSIATGNKQTPNLISSMSGDVILVRVPQAAPAQTPGGVLKVKLVSLTKYGMGYDARYDPNEADSNASSDATKFVGELGAMFSELFGPEKIELVGSEYKIPGGSYSSGYGADEFGSTYSAWAVARLAPDFPDDTFVKLLGDWTPDRITIEINQRIDIMKAYSSFKKRGFKIEEFIPGKRLFAHPENKYAKLQVENGEVDATFSVVKDAGPLVFSMKDISLTYLVSLLA